MKQHMPLQLYAGKIGTMFFVGLVILSLNSCTDMFRSDIVPPAVFIISPINGASSLSGNIPIQAKVYDNSPIEYVDFYINAVFVARVKSEPYTYYWNTNFWRFSIGNNIYVKACDKYGNIAQSAPVTVTLRRSRLVGPQGVYPPDEALISSTNVSLHWLSQRYATKYRLEIGTEADMTKDYVLKEETADTSIHIILPRNRYYWHVQAEMELKDSVFYNSNFSRVKCFFIGERIFVRQYEGDAEEWGEFVFQRSDSSYRILATRRINLRNDFRYQLLLIDTDILGNLRKKSEFKSFQKPSAAIQFDVNTIVAGYNITDEATWIAVDTSGVIQWQTTLEGRTVAKALLAGSSGHLYSVVENRIAEDSTVLEWLRMSLDGAILARRALFNYSSDSGTRWFLAENRTGEYLLFGDPDSVLHLYRINEAGALLAHFTYDEVWPRQAVAVKTDNGGNILLFANSLDSDQSSGIIIFVNANGQAQRRKTFGGADADLFRAVQQTPDGGYIITGSTKSASYGLTDIWIVRLDANGSELWSQNYGKTMDNIGAAALQTFDGGFAVVGTIGRYAAGTNYDTIFLKTDRYGLTIRNWFHE